MYLQATLPEVQCPCSESKCFRWVNYIGHALIKTVEVEIGGQRIDKHYGDWLNIWNELTQEPGHQVGYDNMVGNTIFLTGAGLSNTEATTLYIPFQFWLNYLTKRIDISEDPLKILRGNKEIDISILNL